MGTDIREGKGTLIEPDGSMYEGWFMDNKYHGNGRMIRPDGTVIDG